METAAKAPESVRPADKVLQALATLAALIDSTIREVKSLDGEFQTRLLQAVHDTEASLQAQTAEHVERAREEVQEELNSRFQNDLRAGLDSLKSEFEIERERFKNELREAVEAGAKLQSEMSGLIAEVQQVKDDSAAQLETERETSRKAVHDTEASLQAQAAENIEHARQEVQEELNSKFQIERERLNKELLDAVEAGAKLKSEVSELIAEVQQVKDNSASKIERETERAAKAVQDAEASLQAQAIEKVERARQEVQEQLKSEFEIERERFNKELLDAVEAGAKLKSEVSELIAEVQQVKDNSASKIERERERAAKAVQDAEESLQAQAIEKVERARQAVQDELNSKYRKDLQTALEGLKGEFEIERARLNKELLHNVEAASKLEAERSGLIAEVQRVKSDSAAEIEKAREEAKAVTSKQPASSGPAAPPASLQQEIDRAEAKLKEILKLIDNPATELSTVIRKNVEKSELEAYLKGIRLVLDTKG